MLFRSPETEKIGEILGDNGDADARGDRVHRQANSRHENGGLYTVGGVIEVDPIEPGFSKSHGRQRRINSIANRHPQIVLSFEIGGDKQIAEPRIIPPIRFEDTRSLGARRLPLADRTSVR